MVKNKLRFRSSIYRTSRIAMGMIPFLGTQFENHWPRQHGQMMHMLRFVVQLLGRVQLFETPWTAAHQACLVFTISRSLLKFMSIESTMLSNHLILCDSFLLLPSVLPSIRVFSNKSALHISWPKCWSFSLSISPSNEYSGLISFRIDWLDLLVVQETVKSLL